MSYIISDYYYYYLTIDHPHQHKMSSLLFQGSNCLRQRILLSILTGKPIIIDSIRNDQLTGGDPEEIVGLLDYERNLLELCEKITHSTIVSINKTGTKLTFKPGTLVGGEIKHDCDVSRSISYYLELLLALGPFCKKQLAATLNGVTNDQTDPNVDALKLSSLPILKRFLGDHEGQKLEIKVQARGFKPEGGGQILFTCPIARQLIPVQLTNPGKIKRIRGVAVATRVSPQMANRMIEVAKGLLLQYLPDVYIYSDHHKGKSSGNSPGFAISLVAETIEGCFYTSDAVSNPKGSPIGPSLAEDVAKEATYRLFEEIYRGGCIDSCNQSLAITMMAFNQKDVSKILFGPLSMYSVHYLRHLKEFCGLTFILDSNDAPKITATCIGVGYTNFSRPTY